MESETGGGGRWKVKGGGGRWKVKLEEEEM